MTDTLPAEEFLFPWLGAKLWEGQPKCGRERSNWLTPFHTICTPMQTSRNEVSLTITLVPVGPSTVARRSAKA